MKHRAHGLNASILVLVFAAVVAAQSTEIEQLRSEAEQGEAEGQFLLGTMYLGEGLPQDYQEAMKWFRLAVEQGHTNAQFNLGVGHTNGEGVPQDYIQSHKWINLAASQTTPEKAGDYRPTPLNKTSKGSADAL